MLKSKSPKFAKNPKSFYAQMALDTIVEFQSIPKDHKSCIKQVEYNQMRCEKTHMDRLDAVKVNQIRPSCCCLPPSSAIAVNGSPFSALGGPPLMLKAPSFTR